jgi:ParB family transcriptional regulator, chromosome partitioning protein
MSALAVDKTWVSRMISITKRIPPAVIDAIGPAPGAGRDRWMDLATRFEESGKETKFLPLLESTTFQEADSEARFVQVYDFVLPGGAAAAEKTGRSEGSAGRREVQQWGPSAENDRVVSLTHNMRASMLSIDRRIAPGFGEFLLARMESLFAEYTETQGEAGGGRYLPTRHGKKASTVR